MTLISVLIVEDDEWLAEQYAFTLEHAGYAPRVAHDAVEAIVQIDSMLPQVIVLDVLLAATTAFTLLHELQSYSDTGAIPVVLCTNLASDIPLETVRSYGVRKVLDKSTMTPDDVAVAVRSVLV